jgi:transcriptional regulator with XRE-family HTH domain
MELGDAIKARRSSLGLSQNELARAAGLNQPTVQKIESGDRASPSVHIVAKIARALNCSIEDLLVGDITRLAHRPTHPESIEDQVAQLRSDLLDIGETARMALALGRKHEAELAPRRTRKAAQ